MKSALITILVAGLTIKAVALADEVAPAAPLLPWVATSQNGYYLFKMVPALRDMELMDHRRWPNWRSLLDERRKVGEPEAFGIAYRITGGGQLEELWRTKDRFERGVSL